MEKLDEAMIWSMAYSSAFVAGVYRVFGGRPESGAMISTRKSIARDAYEIANQAVRALEDLEEEERSTEALYHEENETAKAEAMKAQPWTRPRDLGEE